MSGGAPICIRVSAGPGELRVAVVDETAAGDESLLDYAIWRPGAPDRVGDLHRGRVVAPVPAMAGAFIALSDGQEGFLPDSDGAAGLGVGDLVGVRISRAAQGGKGPRLTARLDEADSALANDGPARLIRRGPSAVAHLAVLYPDAPVLVDDPFWVPRLRAEIGTESRVRSIARAFDDGLAAEIDALALPDVALPGGALLRIHPTPALVAIDIDAGAATADTRGKAAAQMALNRALLPALARQIRLRDLSGAIVVDLAGMAARKRAALAPGFVDALAADPRQPRFLGFTALGLAEIQRPRIHPPLHERLAGPHAAGLTALRAAAAEAAANPAHALAVRAAPALVAALQADATALADYARRTGRAAVLRADPGRPLPLPTETSWTAWTLETV